MQERRSGATYQKVISILFAGLLTATGIIWNNSQNQLAKSLTQIEKLMEVINLMQKEMVAINYKMEMLQYRVDNIDDKIGFISNERDNEFPSKPRFGRK